MDCVSVVNIVGEVGAVSVVIAVNEIKVLSAVVQFYSYAVV